jgi:hypothetical protein
VRVRTKASRTAKRPRTCRCASDSRWAGAIRAEQTGLLQGPGVPPIGLDLPGPRDGLHTLKRTNLWKFSLSLPSRCLLRLDERVFYIVNGISTGFYPFQQVFATISALIFAERLCYCPRSECGRPFLRSKGQHYCTTRCAQQERSQRFRRKHPDYRREQHVKSARAKTGGPRVIPVRRRTKRSGPQLDTNAQPE